MRKNSAFLVASFLKRYQVGGPRLTFQILLADQQNAFVSCAGIQAGEVIGRMHFVVSSC